MKNILFSIILIVAIFLASCVKDDNAPLYNREGEVTYKFELIKQNFEHNGIVGDLYSTKSGQKFIEVNETYTKAAVNYIYKKDASVTYEITCPESGSNCAKGKLNGEDVL